MNHLRLMAHEPERDFVASVKLLRPHHWRIHLAFILAEAIRTSRDERSEGRHGAAPDDPPGGAAA